MYNKGITKEFALRKFIPSKAAWMIRNRIKTLKRNGRLQQNVIHQITPINKDEDVPLFLQVWLFLKLLFLY